MKKVGYPREAMRVVVSGLVEEQEWRSWACWPGEGPLLPPCPLKLPLLSHPAWPFLPPTWERDLVYSAQMFVFNK